MKIKLVIAILLLLALAAGGLCYGLWSARQRVQINYSTVSPQGTYKVALAGKEGKPMAPFIFPGDLNNREVTIDVSRSGQPLIAGYSIYSGDAYDSDFTFLYPEHEWLSDSVVQFRDDGKSSDKDEIYIVNQSRQTLPFLCVNAGKTNIFLLFDLKPGSSCKLAVHLHSFERVVGCQGRFQDAPLFAYKDVYFPSQEDDPPQSHFCVVIKDSEVTIQSKEFEGKALNGITVPKGECVF